MRIADFLDRKLGLNLFKTAPQLRTQTPETAVSAVVKPEPGNQQPSSRHHHRMGFTSVQGVVATTSTPKGASFTSRPAEAFQGCKVASEAELKYRSIEFGIKQNHHEFSLRDKVDSHREIEVNAGPACPIRFATSEHKEESLTDQCLTAAEIEWRRWSGWQLERTAEKHFRKKWA